MNSNLSYQELLADDYNVMLNEKILVSFMSDFSDEELNAINKEEEMEHWKAPTRLSDGGTASYKAWSREDHLRFLEAVQLYSIDEHNKIAEYIHTRTPHQVGLHARAYSNRKKVAPSILSASTEALIFNNNSASNNSLYGDFYGQSSGTAFVSNPGVNKYPVPSLSASAHEWTPEEQQGFEDGLRKFPADQFNAATRWIKIAASLVGGRKSAQDVARRYESLNLSEKKQANSQQGKADPDTKTTTTRGRKRPTSSAEVPATKSRNSKRKGKDVKELHAQTSSPPLPTATIASPPPPITNTSTNTNSTMSSPPPTLSEIPPDFFERANKMLDDSLELINAIQPMDAAPNTVARNLDLMIRIRDSLMNIIQWTGVIPNSLGAFHSMPPLPVRINDMLINYLVKQFPAPQLPASASAMSPPVMVPLSRPSLSAMSFTPTSLTGFSPSSMLGNSPSTMLSPNTAQSLFSPSSVLNLTPLAHSPSSLGSGQGSMFSSAHAGFMSPTSMLNLSPLVTSSIDPNFLTMHSSPRVAPP